MNLKHLDIGLIDSDLIWMLSLAFLILPLVFFPNKMKFGRIEGVILLLFYAFFINKLEEALNKASCFKTASFGFNSFSLNSFLTG